MARRDPWLYLGLTAFFGLVFLALFGERIAPHEAIYFVPEHGDDPRPYDPGLVFPFGSDVLGRDLFSVVLAGARATLAIVVLSGVARVFAGALVAVLSSWWRPTRAATESLAELASAVPATLVALLVVKVFLKTDPTLLAIIGALLVTGWAGPYRVLRAEVDRVRAMDFTQGALAIGVGRWRLFWRHHVPHLAPVLAINLSQQIVASLVLVAELGVLSVFVGATRLINLEESLTRAAIREVPAALVADPPEWGGILANARTIESLWTTRWTFLVPGAAFALSALAVAIIGHALARRYARRDLVEDLRGRGAAAVGLLVVALFLTSTLVPERYAAARAWAASARMEVRATTDIEHAFTEAGLRPVGASYRVSREFTSIIRTSAARVTAGSVTIAEPFPHSSLNVPDPNRTVRSYVSGRTGGGVVEAPLVFASRGVNAGDIPPPLTASVSSSNDIGRLIQSTGYADDYAGIDVRGKVVVLVRFLGIEGTGVLRSRQFGAATGPLPVDSIASAIKRGAAAVIFVDPALWLYNDRDSAATYASGILTGGRNPYLRAEQFDPPAGTGGVPVVVLGEVAGQQLVAQFGIDLSPFFRLDQRGDTRHGVSLSRELGVTARVEVPLRPQSAVTTTRLAEIADAPQSAGRVVVWSIRRPDAPHPSTDVLAALGRSLDDRRVPFVLVEFDPSLDAAANAKSVGEVLKDKRIALVVVLDRLDGDALRFTTPHGDLIPALDLYAEKAGARYRTTRVTSSPADISEVAPFFDIKTVLISGSGGAGDLRADAAALLGYLAGRLALGAEEIPR